MTNTINITTITNTDRGIGCYWCGEPIAYGQKAVSVDGTTYCCKQCAKESEGAE